MRHTSGNPAARAWLERPREAERNAERLRRRVENLRLLTTDTSSHLTGMPRTESPDLQRTASLLAEIDEAERALAAAEAEAEALRVETGVAVCRVPDPVQQRVLLLRYLEGRSIKDIAARISYSRTQTYRFHELGLAEIGKML